MMKARFGSVGVIAAVALAACSGGVGDSSSKVGESEQGIIRPTATGGRNEVVLIYAIVFGQSGQTTRVCSGSYFAPRVVLTAAHCLDADPAKSESVAQVLVYFGDDFATDFSQLTPFGSTFHAPAPGQPSSWAVADSFETHPAWDRQLIHPDMGVVYLDRKLPFDPLPLARFPLGPSWVNRSVTISGWGDNVATGPTTGTGSRVQRTGVTRLLGSPTAADFHAEDPNPGMLVPAVRKNVIKMDGHAPNSNACFGDSGGPILVNQGGQQYIAGVEYFGGLFCEDYALSTRIDPFLPFLDEAYRKGGQAPLVPSLDCVAPNADGTLTAFFGYANANGVSINVPLGLKNALPVFDPSALRPTLFHPGVHHFVFGADFLPGQTLFYRLAPENSPSTLLRVDKNSPRCGAAQARQAVCGQSCRGQLRSGCTGLQNYADCIDGCVGFYDIFASSPQCLPQLDAWNQCTASATPGPASWQCFPESSPGSADGVADATACDPLIDAFFGCLG